LRFLPDIRYGTETYPEKVARRLRALNLVVWIVGAVTACTAVVQFLDPTPGVWKVGVVSILAASIFASVPLLHRFGPLAAAPAIIVVAYVYLFVLIYRLGTGSGLQTYYLMTAGLVLVFFGIERVLLSAFFGVLAVLLIVSLEILVPNDTGMVPAATLFGIFVATTIATCTLLLAGVFYTLREAARAEESLAREHEVAQDKTRQLEIADRYKSHFLASASHDLRQPLHALNLFVAQLQGESEPAERKRLIARIDAAVTSMNELFEALLDMTKLEAGILKTNPAEFPIARLLERIETTFADAAGKKGLRLRVVASEAWVASDPILLERILLNLASNAVRYTEHGGVVVGCRRRGPELRIDVCDTGAGIPQDQRQRIFAEFYQLAGAGPDHNGGLGLGLAIVDRLGRLLGHPVELDSRPGRGSRFSVPVPLAAQPQGATERAASSLAVADPARGKKVIVIDDDALVLDGMRGILQSWGCQVQTATSGAAAIAGLAKDGGPPDLIISDSRLADGKTGIEATKDLRAAVGAPVPAFVITGDTAPERLREASAGGFHLLHKPVSPMALRTTLNRLLKAHDARVSTGRGAIRR
jgi:signal transduction histidine kinase/ActR/RegA family two-component response regulator